MRERKNARVSETSRICCLSEVVMAQKNSHVPTPVMILKKTFVIFFFFFFWSLLQPLRLLLQMKKGIQNMPRRGTTRLLPEG